MQPPAHSTANRPGSRRATAALLTLLAACTASPPPSTAGALPLELPADWQQQPPAAGAALADGWWQDFGDAELELAILLALTGNPDLRATVARLEAAVQTRAIAAGGLLPELDLGFESQRSRRLFLGFPFGGGGIPSATVTTFGLALNLRWELDVWGRIRSGDAAALADLQATAADHAGARLSLVGQTCKAWFAAISARQQEALAAATAASMQRTLDDVRERFRRGLRPALDVQLAATNFANAEAAVQRRREAAAMALQQLDLLLGRYPTASLQLPEVLPTSMPPLPASLPGELLQRRPDLHAAERRLAAAGCRVDAARAALYPRLSLAAGGGTNTLRTEDLLDDDFRIWNVGANLLQPLFRGGALRADVARADARREEALASYAGAVLRAAGEVEAALRAEVLLAEQQAAVDRAAEHATRSSALALERWQLGLADFLLVADSQRQAYAAESTRLDLLRQRLDNRIDLYLALGGGYAVDVAEP